jgi:hypothetical protein
LDVEGSRSNIPGEPPTPMGPFYFVVTSLDRNYNESVMSNVLQVNPPPVPTLAFPLNNSINLEDTITLKWNYPNLASSYHLQISKVSTFDSLIVYDVSSISDTLKIVTGLEGQTKYYWRVNCTNAGGTSNYSASFNFTTGFPTAPQLAYPLHNTGGIPIDTILYWHPSTAVASYDLLLARGADFAQNTIVLDTTGLIDTSYAINNLLYNTFYFWKVKANNTFGSSNWSTPWRFKTALISGVDDLGYTPVQYSLEQNYPNPFNPTTNFVFSISENGLTTIKIYNLLGQEVATIVNDSLTPGTYQFTFDASNLSSGIYIYRLRVNDFSASKKMIFIK